MWTLHQTKRWELINPVAVGFSRGNHSMEHSQCDNNNNNNNNNNNDKER